MDQHFLQQRIEYLKQEFEKAAALTNFLKGQWQEAMLLLEALVKGFACAGAPSTPAAPGAPVAPVLPSDASLASTASPAAQS